MINSSPLRSLAKKTGTFYLILKFCQKKKLHNWLKNGTTGPAPQITKLNIIKHYVKTQDPEVFVETGTYRGDTVEYIAKTGKRCITIELSKHYYTEAKKNLSKYKNIQVLQGNSGKLLKEVIERENKRIVFWLDGHSSGGKTAQPEVDTPIIEELITIFNHPINQHTILIDDARLFNGENGYPTLKRLLEIVEENGNYDTLIASDIIRLTPKY
ncbi:hypothetical protein [Pelagicoccus sp. SDUM812003]|uniref:hypothetical protein n=1 Tax=Pelagicoccus sp. SDUM812003 TaxID=3041267 RepID=UPI00280F10A0|nr:hypothetical protein [Pelagicoccus sp. SDUM812003]MDQ8205603.1 hypothetical protein [Pelagicoccus sp. SDUM812003]